VTYSRSKGVRVVTSLGERYDTRDTSGTYVPRLGQFVTTLPMLTASESDARPNWLSAARNAQYPLVLALLKQDLPIPDCTVVGRNAIDDHDCYRLVFSEENWRFELYVDCWSYVLRQAELQPISAVEETASENAESRWSYRFELSDVQLNGRLNPDDLRFSGVPSIPQLTQVKWPLPHKN
jgi:hypothetical protein